MDYKVKLQQFEGPLDLLLFLIKKEEINIYDIPIAQITQQYVEYIRMLEFLNLELAGEFLVMAATLMRIKARMLLPARPDEAEEEVDPRAELVQQLLEYQKFKAAATELEAMEYQRRLVFPRPEATDGKGVVEAEETYNLFELISAFKKVLEKSQVRYIEVHPEEISLEARIDALKGRIAQAGELAFGDLFEGDASRMDLVVTFLALLEILKMGFARARQTKPFGEIWIQLVPAENDCGRDQADN
ncbi:MAG TPA: segregation/condensation protein A [bacterium]|nr:segregation/condensation protein A [bacterium]